MSAERAQAMALANRVLDRPGADPDDDLATLARHFLRSVFIDPAAFNKALFVELGEAEYKLARWSLGADPWHYWSREAIEAAVSTVIGQMREVSP